MAYKKPEIVAKSAAKQSFVAACSPSSGQPPRYCHTVSCEVRKYD